MKTAYILHGVCDAEEYYEMDFPSPSNAHWIPWLQQKLLREDIMCQCLEMPAPYNPKYSEWLSTFKQAQIKDDSIIIGHSSGCGFILKWLGQNPKVKMNKLILVAPYLDPIRKYADFLKCNLDKSIAKRINEIHVLYSTDEDVEGVIETKDLIMKTYPTAKLHTFNNKGHFCLGDMGTTAFPELWEICKNTAQ